MKIGINSGFFTNFFDEYNVFEAAKKCGFDAVDYGYYEFCEENSEYNTENYLEHAHKIKEITDNLGISIYQIHAPMTKKIGIDPKEDYYYEMTLKCFEVAKELGCSYVVMHPRKYQDAKTYNEIEKQKEYNLHYFKKLGEFAKKQGIKIAIENLFRYDDTTHCSEETTFKSPYEMKEFLDKLGDDFVACVDTGHALINGYQPSIYLEVLKEKVKVVHIHDNFMNLDQHQMPYFGCVDWDDFAKTLKAINFDGVFSLEILESSFPDDNFVDAKLAEGRFGYEIAKAIIKKYNL